MLTFLHAAYIHLDSPMRGLSHYEGEPPIEEIRGATRGYKRDVHWIIVLIKIWDIEPVCGIQ